VSQGKKSELEKCGNLLKGAEGSPFSIHAWRKKDTGYWGICMNFKVKREE